MMAPLFKQKERKSFARFYTVFVFALLMQLPMSALGAGQASVETRVVKAVDAWQLAVAEDLIKAQWFDAPNNKVYQLLAAEVLHQRGRDDAAYGLMHDALFTEPLHGVQALTPDLHDRFMGLWPRVQAAYKNAVGSQTIKSTHFAQHFTDKDRIVAAAAQPVLEAAYQALVQFLDFTPLQPHERIVVDWLPNPEALADATGLPIQAIETSGTIAVCKFHRLMVISPAATLAGYDWRDTLAHELTHLFVGQKSHDQAPVWLQEGLAKFFQSTWHGAPGQAISPESRASLAKAAKEERLVPLARMHPSMARLPSQADAALAFSEVFVLIEDIFMRYGPKAWPKFLDDLKDGLLLEEALARRFKTSLGALEQRIRVLAAKNTKQRPNAKTVPTQDKVVFRSDNSSSTHDDALRAIDDETVNKPARLAELLFLRGHLKAAVIPLQRASKAGRHRFATIDRRLASAWLQQGRLTQARQLAQTAAQIHPEDQALALCLGHIALAQKDYQQAKAAFIKGLWDNPFIVSGHQGLAQTLRALGDIPRADEETFFAELCSRPRQKPKLPAAQSDAVFINIITDTWEDVVLDGHECMPTPQWRRPSDSKEHSLRFASEPSSADKPLHPHHDATFCLGRQRACRKISL